MLKKLRSLFAKKSADVEKMPSGQPSQKRYTYVLRDLNGKIVKGTITAENLRAALKKLEPNAIKVISVEKIHFEETLAVNKLKLRDLMVFFRELAVIYKSGIPIHRAINVVQKETEDPDIQKIFIHMRDSLRHGKSFSESMALFPEIFTRFHRSLVKAAEQGGYLEKGLDYLSVVIEKEVTLRMKVSTSLNYPFFVFLFGLAGCILVFMWISPFLHMIVSSFGINLPIYTRIMLALAQMTHRFFFLMPFLVAAGFVLMSFQKKLFRNQKVKLYWEQFILSIPRVKDLVQKSILAHALIVLSSLLRAGVKLTYCLELAAESCDSIIFGTAFQIISEQIKEGKTIAECMSEQPRYFPRVLVAMVTVGEETGELSDTIDKIASFYESDVYIAADSFTRFIEPFASILLGAFVAALVFSFFIPIYSILNRL
ncbi:MAG: type II secretion system F family protein [Vulcanimicrobiota bacterium]